MAKNQVLQFRATEVQRAIINANAKREGLSLSDFLLRRAMMAEASPIDDTEIAPRIHFALPANAPIADKKLAELKSSGLKIASQLEQRYWAILRPAGRTRQGIYQPKGFA
jgi:hypothetical protein